MSFDGNFSQFKTSAESGLVKKIRAMDSALDFAENATRYGLRSNYDLEFLSPSDISIRFKLKDGPIVSTLQEAYESFLGLFQIYGEHVTKENTRVTETEDGPCIEFRFTDI